MKVLTAAAAMALCIAANAQKLTFGEKEKIMVADNQDVPVQFIPKTQTKLEKGEMYGFLTFPVVNKINEVPDFAKASTLTLKTLRENGFDSPVFFSAVSLSADLDYENGKIIIGFRPFSGNDALNTFFKDNLFFIPLDDRVNLSVPYRCFQGGIYTVPIRIFLASRNSPNVNNVLTAPTIGAIFGYKWGHIHFVKIPTEKEARKYVKGISVNALLGIGKITIDEGNSVPADQPFSGDVPAISTGLAAGFHYNKFSVLPSFGFDVPLSCAAKGWAFKGRPWFGIGGGIGLF